MHIHKRSVVLLKKTDFCCYVCQGLQLRSNIGQVTHTCCVSVTSGIIYYWPNGGDAICRVGYRGPGANRSQRDWLCEFLHLFAIQLVSQSVSLVHFNRFYRAACKQTRSSDENSVCLSVCHTRVLWQNGRKVCPDFYTARKNIYPSFLRRRMVGGGGATPSTWNFGSTDPIGAKSPIFNQ